MLSGREADWDACRSVLEGHTDDVNAVVFSRDGQLVASASYDSTVRVWETATGRCRHELTGHTGIVRAVVFSRDGQLVASASYDSTVRVWETATGMCRTVLDSPASYIGELAFSPDGSALHTNGGDIPLPSDLNLTPPVEPEEHASHLSVGDQWVLRNTQRFLWLPFEYRTHYTAVCRDMVCLGCPSGRVALLRLQ
jgi:WD40 repeat protein